MVDRGLLASDDISPRRQRVRTDVPERGVTAVVPKVDGSAWWENQMPVCVDGDSVDEGSLRICIDLCDQALELGRRDEPPAQFDDNCVGVMSVEKNSPCPSMTDSRITRGARRFTRLQAGTSSRTSLSRPPGGR